MRKDETKCRKRMNREQSGETGENRRKGCQTHETADIVHIMDTRRCRRRRLAGPPMTQPVGRTREEPFFPCFSIEETNQVPPPLPPPTCMYEVRRAVRTATLPQGRTQPCIRAKTFGEGSAGGGKADWGQGTERQGGGELTQTGGADN